MATCAVLGSTGQIGGSTLQILLQSPQRKVNAYARSKKRLLALQPGLDSSPNVSIYEGALQDISTLTDCIAGTSVVFLAVGASENIPGCDIAQQQAKAAVEALNELHKHDSQARLPQLIVVSSSSLEKSLCKDIPPIAQWLLHTCASNVYADLRLAEQYLRSHEWIKQVYIKPGGLVHDKPRGHILNTQRQETFLSFLDLAAGMVEVADADDDKWDMQNVSVVPASPGTRVEWRVPYFALKGALCHYMPFLYPYVSSWLP